MIQVTKHIEPIVPGDEFSPDILIFTVSSDKIANFDTVAFPDEDYLYPSQLRFVKNHTSESYLPTDTWIRDIHIYIYQHL